MYEYEINICKDDYDKYVDIWGAAFLWLNDRCGVEYNYCYDDGECESAIYKTICNEYIETDSSTYSHYEIDFDDPKWEQKLVNEMEIVAKRFFKEVDI